MVNLLDRELVLNQEGSATNKSSRSISHIRPCHTHECGDLDMELDMELAVTQLDHVQVHAQDLCRSL